jgi:integrase
VARKSIEGIEVRHSRSCPARGWEECGCKPSYQANVWSNRDQKRIRKTFPTLAAAKAWRADAIKGLSEGRLRAPTADTVREASEAFIAGMKDGSVRDRSGRIYKPSTIRSYELSLEKYVYPELGACKLSAVQYPDLQDFVDRLAAKGLDGSTIRNTVNPLRRIYKKHRYQIPVNPTAGLEFIAPRNAPKEPVLPDVASAMIEALRVDDGPIIATAFYAGLRKGELQALRIEDVELYEGWGVVHVRRNWDRYEGEVAPKSGAGIRSIPIPRQLYEVLDEHLLRIDRTEGLLFGPNGSEPFNYTTLRERMERAWRKAGITPSDFQLHQARHSYKSYLEATEIRDSRINRYMGHADHSVQARYSHQLDPLYLDDSQALTRYLDRADAPTREALRDSRATVSDTA